MGRKLYDWYFKQKVTENELTDGFTEVRDFSADFIADHLVPGFSAIPSLTQHSPTANFTVDVNIPGSGGIVGYDPIGRRIGIPSTQVVNLATVSGGPVTLPTSGNEKYISILVGWDQFESDPRVDGNAVPLNYVLEDGYVFSVIQGTQATAGTATKPAHPGDNRLIIGDILLTPTSTSILNAAIDQLRMTRLNLNNEVQGFDANEASINAGARGIPTTGYTQTYWFKRGGKIAGGIRLLEGANPATDAPVVQVSRFTNSDNMSWSTISNGVVSGVFETVDASVREGAIELGAGSNVSITRVGNKFTFAAATGAAGWNDAGAYVETLDPNDAVKLGFAGAPHASLKLDVRSVTQGSRFNPMTTTEKNAIATPATGTLVFDTTLNRYEYYNGSAWAQVGGGGSGQQRRVFAYTLTGTDISNKYKDLPNIPITDTVEFYPKSGNHFYPGDHFAIITDGVDLKRLIWDPTDPNVGDGITSFVAGDKIVVVYAY